APGGRRSRDGGTEVTGAPSRAYSWYALGLLALINLLSFVNRNIVFALFDPIKRDLHLTDAQLGWLATDFGELLLTRALVGAGGAAFGAAAQSLAADYFPSRGRAVAMGILATGI